MKKTLITLLLLLISNFSGAALPRYPVGDAVLYGTVPYAATTTIIIASSTSNKNVGVDYVCDGIADEVQINAALAELASSANGGMLILLEGLYNISSAIVIPTLTYGLYTIVGMGAGNTTIYAANGSNCNLIETNIDSGDLTFVILRDFMIQGNRANNPTGGRGYYDGVGSGNCKDTLFQNMFFYHCRGNCVEFDVVWGTKIVDCIFEDSDAKGIYFASGTDARAEGNKFIHILGNCIDTNTPATNIIGNIIFQAGIGTRAINLTSGANYSLVIDNQIHHDVESNGCMGIRTETSHGIFSNNLIECVGNTAMAYGIQCAAASTYNTGDSNKIYIAGQSYYNTGTGNTIGHNGAEKPKACVYQTGGYQITQNDNSVFINSGSPQSVSLTASPTIGEVYHVFNLGSGQVTIMGNGNNVNGSATKIVNSLTGVDLTYFYSGNWSAK